MYFGVKNITKEYENTIVLDNLTYEFSKNGLYVITGESGNGKTTLLNILAGYESADCGEVINNDLSISCVFQNYELLGCLDVEENIFLYNDIHSETERNVSDYEELFKLLNIYNLLNYYPTELSQGQKQRISIARALCSKADIYLLDEPTEALDQDNMKIILDSLTKLAETKLVIMVTHNLYVIENAKANVLKLENGNIKELRHSSYTLKNQSPEIEKTTSLNLKVLKKYEKRILKSKFSKESIFLLISMLCMFLLSLVYEKVFMNDSLVEIANREKLYVEYRGDIDLKNASVEPILDFPKVDLGGQIIDIKMYPKVEKLSEFPCEGICIPEGMGIVLNQRAAKNYLDIFNAKNQNELLGKNIELGLNAANNNINLKFTIQGIVNENDVGDISQIYYSKQDIDDFLKSKKGYNKESLYDLAYRESNMYQITPYNSSDRKVIFDSLNKKKGYEVFNSEYSQWQKKNEKNNRYLPYFFALIILFILFQLIFFAHECKKSWKYHLGSLAILAICSRNLNIVREYYIKIRFSYVSIISLMMLFLYIINGYFYKVNFMYICYICAIAIYICIYDYIHTQSFKLEYISKFLKEDKDYNS